MKEIDIYPNNEVVTVIPPEPIDENEPASLADYFIPNSNEKVLNYAGVRKFGEGTFSTKIGGTTYEVSTHFNSEGTQSVLEQFKKLILSENLI